MKMVLLDGALFNQVTQYVFARNVELLTGETVYLDDSWFYLQHNHYVDRFEEMENHRYQLNKFQDIKPHLLSEYFTPDVWKQLVDQMRNLPTLGGGSHMPQVLKNNGLDLCVICEPPNIMFDGNIVFIPFYHCEPKFLEAKGNIYYHGYFSHGGWFKRHEETFLQELIFAPLSEPEDLKMAEDINNCFSVAIHVRKGYAENGRGVPNEFYKKAIKEVLKKFGKRDIHFFVFADDMDWCMARAEAMGFNQIKNIMTCGRSDRTRETNQCDSQLMSLCDVLIICESIYGFYSGLLNRKKNKIIIDPIPGRSGL